MYPNGFIGFVGLSGSLQENLGLAGYEKKKR